MFLEVNTIGSPEEIKKISSLSPEMKKVKEQRDEEIKAILDGRNKRFLVIIGPCSANDEEAVIEYIHRLKRVQEQIADKVLIVPRIYTNKPRTKGEGYKGMLHQPDPNSKTNIQEGILKLREMHIKAISETGLSAADEMLYPDNYSYVDDLLSYVAIGARSTENQQHRLVGSGVDVALGVKNPMNGSFQVLINSIYACQIPNEFKYADKQVKTTGCPYAHAILRGAVDNFGNNIPNYHYEEIMAFSELYEKTNLSNPSIIIDTNHSNSGKKYLQQIRIVHEVLNNRHHNPQDFAKYIKGFLIESYLEDGNQPIDGKIFGKSITDACIGWTKTEKLLFQIAEKL